MQDPYRAVPVTPEPEILENREQPREGEGRWESIANPHHPDAPEPLSEQEVARMFATGAEKGIVEPTRPSITGRGLEQVGEAAFGEKPKNDMSDLFEVPQETDADMETADLFEVEPEDIIGDDDENNDLLDPGDDLTEVSVEDVMGAPPKPKKVRYQRTSRPYRPEPPTSVGGIR